MARSTILHISLASPEPVKSDATQGHSWLLNAFVVTRDDVVLAFAAPGTTKHENLGRLYSGLHPNADGAFIVELGAILGDRLPALGEEEYVVSVALDEDGDPRTLCFSNQMVRLRYRRSDGAMVTGTVPLSHLEDALETDDVPPTTHVEYLPTVVTARYKMQGVDAEEALSHNLEVAVDDFLERINRVVAAHLMVASVDTGILTPSYDHGSFTSIFLFLQGGEDDLRGNTLGLSAFRVSRVVQNCAGADADRVRRVASGGEPIDDVAQVLRAAKSYIDAGLGQFALLQLAVAAEIATTRYTHHQYSVRGVSKTKLDQFRSEMTFSLLLNVEVMALAPPEKKPDRAVLGQVDRVRDLRNRMMHYGEFNTTALELRVLHSAVADYIAYLSSATTNS